MSKHQTSHSSPLPPTSSKDYFWAGKPFTQRVVVPPPPSVEVEHTVFDIHGYRVCTSCPFRHTVMPIVDDNE